MNKKNQIWVCTKEQLIEGDYIRINVLYANEPASVIVFRYKEHCLAYLNLCVHMPRTLDCEKDMIFDDKRESLRCSMHGITYDPITGKSMSEICRGQKLTPINIQESADGVWISDKQIKPCSQNIF